MRGAARGSWRGVVESGAGFFALYVALQITVYNPTVSRLESRRRSVDCRVVLRVRASATDTAVQQNKTFSSHTHARKTRWSAHLPIKARLRPRHLR